MHTQTKEQGKTELRPAFIGQEWEIFLPAVAEQEPGLHDTGTALRQAANIIRAQEERIRLLEMLALSDELTGLANRRGFSAAFNRELSLARRDHAYGGVLAMVDLDGFKAINDEHGHDIGDAILREVAYQVRKDLRAFELVYRVGGEEFLIVLPGMSENQAIDTAERLRETISNVRVAGDVGVTASLGISSGTGARIDLEPLYREADEALYTAKRDGRDRTAVWAKPEPAIATVADLGARR